MQSIFNFNVHSPQLHFVRHFTVVKNQHSLKNNCFIQNLTCLEKSMFIHTHVHKNGWPQNSNVYRETIESRGRSRYIFLVSREADPE